MSYYFNKTIFNASFEEVIERVTEELKKEGFGILSDIDIQAALKKKLDVDFRRYRIFGACNPPFAYKSLQSELNIGVMLPCNVVVMEMDNGEIGVSAVDPLASMMAVGNSDLNKIAKQIQQKLSKVIDSL